MLVKIESGREEGTSRNWNDERQKKSNTRDGKEKEMKYERRQIKKERERERKRKNWRGRPQEREGVCVRVCGGLGA